MHEFELRFRGALRNGPTPDDPRAAMIRIADNRGVPAGVECFRTAKRVPEERTADGSGEASAGRAE